jgi:hypothetical protein
MRRQSRRGIAVMICVLVAATSTALAQQGKQKPGAGYNVYTGQSLPEPPALNAYTGGYTRPSPVPPAAPGTVTAPPQKGGRNPYTGKPQRPTTQLNPYTGGEFMPGIHAPPDSLLPNCRAQQLLMNTRGKHSRNRRRRMLLSDNRPQPCQVPDPWGKVCQRRRPRMP